MFDYITSLSVIEHGVNIQNYFKEMNRILKKGGVLLTSSDYWPDKLVNKIIDKDIRKMSRNNVFSKEEIEKKMIDAGVFGIGAVMAMFGTKRFDIL